MKKLILFSLIGLLFLACNTKDSSLESIIENEEQEVTIESLDGEDLNYFSFEFPKGTKVEEYDNKIDFELPDGYLAYGIDENGNYQSMSAGSLFCTCISDQEGCIPSKIGEQIACVMTACDNCEKSGSSLIGNERLKDLIIVNLEDPPVNFIDDVDEIRDKLALPHEFLDLDIIEKELIELEEHLLTSKSTETKIIPIEIYGYIVMIEVPADIDNTSPYISTGEVSCSCNSGGECTINSKLIAVWCDATNCQSCTMSGTIINPDKERYLLQIRDNRIVVD